MDGGQIGSRDFKLCDCLRCHFASLSACGFHGGFCHRQDAVEAVGGDDDLFPDRHDDSGALYFDSGLHEIFQNASDKQPDGTDSALPDAVASHHDFYYDGIFQSLPNELFESACIDGCSIYRSFTHIALPLARTGLFVTGLMTFVANWNELLLAMVFISDDNKKDAAGIPFEICGTV